MRRWVVTLLLEVVMVRQSDELWPSCDVHV